MQVAVDCEKDKKIVSEIEMRMGAVRAFHDGEAVRQYGNGIGKALLRAVERAVGKRFALRKRRKDLVLHADIVDVAADLALAFLRLLRKGDKEIVRVDAFGMVHFR